MKKNYNYEDTESIDLIAWIVIIVCVVLFILFGRF
jgi:hypothetical protein